ncbi:hypothetical protein FHW37_104525 [Neorhizobium alkalisoli]|uniref:Uncharacterized protein n=1 Tax=Neorhizobium alkalisoli TaxID=528178 RepID=A0A561QS77_9HYPH|nr:hypothetical protein FHW37_104525 [Neorhizobium alkalisoli]
MEARWLLSYLLSKPDNWTVVIGDITKKGNCGRDKARKMIAELVKHGYAEREQQRDDGKFGSSVLVIFDEPRSVEATNSGNSVAFLPQTDLPATATPSPVSPSPVKSALSNNLNLENTDCQQPDTPPGAMRSARDELMVVLDADHANAVIEHRKKIRKPLTPYAAQLLARRFALMPNPNSAADVMIGNGWQGFEPDWLESRGARGRSPPRQSDFQRRQDAAKAALDQVITGDDDGYGSFDRHHDIELGRSDFGATGKARPRH